MTPDSLSTTWLHHQARAWADDTQRSRRRHTHVRTPLRPRHRPARHHPRPTPRSRRPTLKALYKLLAQQHRIGRFKRAYDPQNWDTQDPVNLALSSANTCLYGIVHATLLAMGCSPALGFVHSGNQQAFVYDIADLYKAELTIPLAFSLHTSTQPEAEARRRFRDGLRLFKLMPRIVNRCPTPPAAGHGHRRSRTPRNSSSTSGTHLRRACPRAQLRQQRPVNRPRTTAP